VPDTDTEGAPETIASHAAAAVPDCLLEQAVNVGASHTVAAQVELESKV
jgi:hypothetical protein